MLSQIVFFQLIRKKRKSIYYQSSARLYHLNVCEDGGGGDLFNSKDIEAMMYTVQFREIRMD